MSLAVSIRDFMSHYRVQSIGTEVFRVIDGVQRIDNPVVILPAMLGAALLIMDELNLDPNEMISKAVKAHAHMKDVDIDTARATREYIRKEITGARF